MVLVTFGPSMKGNNVPVKGVMRAEKGFVKVEVWSIETGININEISQSLQIRYIL